MSWEHNKQHDKAHTASNASLTAILAHATKRIEHAAHALADTGDAAQAQSIIDDVAKLGDELRIVDK